MTTRLGELRRDLGTLRRKRSRVRTATAVSGFATAALVILALAFALDYRIEGDTTFRAGLLAAVVALAAWSWRKYAKPWLGPRETDLDMALMIEDQCRDRGEPLGQDLVAALQFESPEAALWGSVALEQVVVTDVAERSQTLDVFAGLSTDVLARRLGVLTIAGIAAAIAITIYPGHARAFFNRLFLGRMHYPTATVLDKLIINGREVPPAINQEPVIVACAEGQPLDIEVFASHQLPTSGRVELSVTRDRRMTVDLVPVVASSELATREWTAYTGKLPRLNDAVTYQIYLGDAWTDPARIELVPMPVVDCQLLIAPPEYAKAASAEDRGAPAIGTRTLEALEGSQVTLEVACRNKSLASVDVVIDEKSYPLVAVDGEKRRWRLETKDTPLDGVTKELTYKVTARDADGLSPERSPVGSLRIKADRPPRITSQAKTRFVMPSGRPVIEYRVADDYGVSQVVARAKVIRETAGGRETLERPAIPLDLGKTPLVATTPERRTFAAPLSSLALAKGDRLEVVLEVTDYRGPRPGKTAAADALVFTVTDALGVEAAVTELDPALEQQIHSLIQKHLDIGASK